MKLTNGRHSTILFYVFIRVNPWFSSLLRAGRETSIKTGWTTPWRPLMLTFMNTPIVQFGALPVGESARVVGIVSALKTVNALLADPAPGCDIVELRLDRIGVETGDWIDAAHAIEEKGYPVIATLRIPEEGGHWQGTDEDRRPHVLKALEYCACVDIELRSVLLPELADLAAQKNKALIVSHHDYEKTPRLDELRNVLRRAAISERVVVKMAVTVNTQDDVTPLKQLLQESRSAPLCLIGMGDLGTPTRIEFPKLGSCLAYGHIDGSTAPGQLSCRELAEKIVRS